MGANARLAVTQCVVAVERTRNIVGQAVGASAVVMQHLPLP